VAIALICGLAMSGCGRWESTWSAPGETIAEWQALQVKANTTDRIQSVVAPPGGNGHAFRFEVRDDDVAVNAKGQEIPGGWRAEGIGPTEQPSRTAVRYEWNTLFDEHYPEFASWQLFAQWHQQDENSVGSSPPIELIIEQSKIYLHLNRFDPEHPDESLDGGKHLVADLDRGSWHKFRIEIRWALADGSIKLWHNDKQITDLTNVQTLFPLRDNTSAPGTVYFKMGLYRNAVKIGQPCVLFHDEVKRLTGSQ